MVVLPLILPLGPDSAVPVPPLPVDSEQELAPETRIPSPPPLQAVPLPFGLDTHVACAVCQFVLAPSYLQELPKISYIAFELPTVSYYCEVYVSLSFIDLAIIVY